MDNDLTLKAGGLEARLCHRGRIRSGRRSEEDGQALRRRCRPNIYVELNEDVAVEDMGEMASRSGAPARPPDPAGALRRRAFGRPGTLYVNGQATEETVTAAERLGRALGLQPNLLPRWGELRLQGRGCRGGRVREIAANPTGVNMARVASTMRAADELASGHAAAGRAAEKIDGGAADPGRSGLALRARRRCLRRGYRLGPLSASLTPFPALSSS